MIHRRTLLVLLLLSVGLPYLVGLRNDFVWLDHQEIVEGARIADRWAEVPGLFLDDRNFRGYHRPVYNLIHSADYAVWGLEPFGFHLSSMLLHLLNVLLVIALGRRVGLNDGTALAIGALWGLHPVNTAAVGLIHGKADLFVTAMLLSSLLFLDGAVRGSWRLGLASLASFSAALLTKETAFVYPFALLGIWLFWRSGLTRPEGRRLLTLCSVSAVLAAAVAIPRFVGGDHFTSPMGLPERALTFTTVYVDALGRIMLPLRLSVGDTVTRFSALPATIAALYLIVFALLIGAQLHAASRWPWTRKWILVFNLALVPVAQIVPLLHFRADRFLYLPTLGVVGVAAEGMARLRPGRLGARRLAWVALATVAAFFSVRSAARVLELESDRSLFEGEVRRTPDYREGLTVLARAHDREGRHQLAEGYWRRAMEPHPGRISYVDGDAVVVNLGFNLLAQNRPDEAYEYLRSAREDVVGEAARDEADYNLAIAAFGLERYDETLPILSGYVERHPEDARAHYVLGVSALRTGATGVARDALERYLHLRPDAPDRGIVEAYLEPLR